MAAAAEEEEGGGPGAPGAAAAGGEHPERRRRRRRRGGAGDGAGAAAEPTGGARADGARERDAQGREGRGGRARVGGRKAAPADSPEAMALLLRRQRRAERRAWAEGFLAAVCAMLRPGDLAIDCGANEGRVTAALAATGAEVIAFEPDPLTFARLAAAHGQRPNVTLVNAAVGVGTGTVRLMRAGNFEANPGGASLKATILPGGRGIDAANSVEVPLVDFPALVRERSERPDGIAFVKMDIEGAELEILEALLDQGLAGRIRCLVAETHERKFRDLRARYRALRARVAAEVPAGRFSLDWI